MILMIIKKNIYSCYALVSKIQRKYHNGIKKKFFVILIKINPMG